MGWLLIPNNPNWQYDNAPPDPGATITSGSFAIGTRYKITNLSGTSAAQWHTAAGTQSGDSSAALYHADYVVGDTFKAAAAGAGTGKVVLADSSSRELWLKSKDTAGVRIHTDPAGKEHKVYTKVRKVGSDVDTVGEIAKTYWDVKGDDLKFQMEVLIPSDDLSFTIPCQEDGGVAFSAIIDWGDGTTTTTTTYNGGGLTHTYSAGGTYTIKIDGTFPNIFFNNDGAENDPPDGDRLKVKKILNLGHVGWTKFTGAFYGCSNLTEFSAGASDTSGVTTFANAFSACTAMAAPEMRFDTTSAQRFDGMFLLDLFDSISGLDNWNLSSMTDDTTPSLYGPIGNLQVFITNGAKMSTPEYDAMLIAWAAQAPLDIGTAKLGGSKFTAGGEAESAKAVLVNTYGWVITDGGAAP